jgi:hypothetical protein
VAAAAAQAATHPQAAAVPSAAALSATAALSEAASYLAAKVLAARQPGFVQACQQMQQVRRYTCSGHVSTQVPNIRSEGSSWMWVKCPPVIAFVCLGIQ